jgi:leader peptidase (prepilin peptidase)/N-methyltransferase
LIELYLILFGLVISSFLGSLSYRVPRKISMLSPSSYCPSCMKKLGVLELVPVLSYVLLRGRCKGCGSTIPLRFFVVEITLPLLYLALYKRVGTGATFFIFAYLISLMHYLSLVDIDTGSVSVGDMAAVYAGGTTSVFLSFRGVTARDPVQSLYSFGLCLGLVAISMFIVYMLKRKKSLGLGDLVTVPGIALYFGVYGIIRILLFSSVLGVIAGVLLILLKKVGRDFKFPLMPFTAAGVCIEILVFYSNILV